jgi:hypothetical protein
MASVRAGGSSDALRRADTMPRQSPLTQTSRIVVDGVYAETSCTTITPFS